MPGIELILCFFQVKKEITHTVFERVFKYGDIQEISISISIVLFAII